jgi:hypothetical protein
MMQDKMADVKRSEMPKDISTLEAGELQDISHRDKAQDHALAIIGHDRIEFTAQENAAVLRKIDLHLLPLLMWVYMIQFADKTSLNYASVMGIRDDTHLDPNSQQYSWVSSIFYAGYILWE